MAAQPEDAAAVLEAFTHDGESSQVRFCCLQAFRILVVIETLHPFRLPKHLLSRQNKLDFRGKTRRRVVF